jgi:hypothetical protein
MSLPNTPINEAFDYDSTIKPNQVISTYSTICIFCSNPNTIALLNDGSFRQCLKCRKNFKARITQKK